MVPRYQATNFMFRGNFFCGDYIESQYYNHLSAKKSKNISKGGRLVTDNICTIFHSFQDVLSDAKIKRIRNIGGDNPLSV